MNSVLPAAADAHALIQLDANIRKRCLPNVVLFKFPLNSGAKQFRCHLKKVLHTGLRVSRVNSRILPNLIESILNLVDQRSYLTKLKWLNIRQGTGDFAEMLVNLCCIFTQLFVWIWTNVLSLVFLPTLDFIDRWKNASELVDIEVLLSQTISTFSSRFLKSSLQTVQKIAQLSVSFGITLVGATEQNCRVYVR